MREKKENFTLDWEDYTRCKEYLQRKNIYQRNDKCYRFFEGNQWGNDAPTGMPKPQLNILKPALTYQVAIVCRNPFAITFSNNQFNDPFLSTYTDLICGKLNGMVAKVWENNGMDLKQWQVVREAGIVGGAGIYSYWDKEKNSISVEIKRDTEILVADEQEEDIQRQKFIILPFRDLVSNVRREAKECGVLEEDIKNILPDDEDRNIAPMEGKNEIEYNDDGDGKVLCIMKFWKGKDGYCWMRKSTRNVVYHKAERLNFNRYPIDYLVWNRSVGSRRGKGAIFEWIPNQIEINCTLARNSIAVMQNAYPKLVYNEEFISNPESIADVGTAIGVMGNVEDVRKMVTYLQPQPISPDAMNLVNTLIEHTKSLIGRDVTSDVNPENASGKAILAVQDANAVPLSMQIAEVRDFIENVGRTWWDILVSSSVNGLEFTYEGSESIPKLDNMGNATIDEMGNPIMEEMKVQKVGIIPKELIDKMKVNVRCDISAQNSYSKYAVESSLDNLLASGLITLEEYAKVLPNDSVMPKKKLMEIVEKREELQAIIKEKEQYKALYSELASAIQTYKAEGDNILNGLYGSNASKIEGANEPIVENKGVPTT